MQFKLSSIVALLLLLLTGNALGCYSGGTTWGEVGNDDEVNNGLSALCDKFAGDYVFHVENVQCQNVNGHGIHGSILVTEGPYGKLGAYVSQEACMDVLKQTS
ncbi:hypothetical protein SLS63_012580 [Diaporthe eres]|uniref:Uncharacterized protein n=1 Tax=Diaporthe eres TaxID=83184 RepID=A0ABR1NQU2_DIAER